MLYRMHIEYMDGYIEDFIEYREPNESITIYPNQEGIRHASCRPFKYEVPKHPILPKMIVRLGDKTFIYPSQIQCHPKTTLNDIKETKSIEQIRVEKTIEPKKKEETKSWKFESTSGGGTYIVTQTPKGLKCDCPGTWRAKDRRCKHIKEVETY
jgi:hypothetical protein